MKTEVGSGAEAEAEVGSGPEAEAEVGSGPEAEAEVGSGPGSGAEAQARVGSGAETEARVGSGAETEARVGSGAGSGSRSRAEAEAGELGGATVRDAISAPDAEGKPRRTTRRFPLFTRDTARPEGGGRAASGDAPAPARQWPILTVLSAVALGLLLTALDVFRVGTILIGAALLAGAVMRWMLPSVGMLAVRSRFTDMLTYGVLGIAIVVLALMAQPNPMLEIPFLDDTLHFTVR
ncbi:DUF3017 domain-containing protein [Streptomyces sp. NPDC006290]|uniref:DUF3017 domain-containing protein n=1 Tax=Streptomyces sp. NPDC006290 TaxID=3156745 RepID=UPI0033AF680D